jgi:hypothetical protein
MTGVDQLPGFDHRTGFDQKAEFDQLTGNDYQAGVAPIARGRWRYENAGVSSR